MKNSVILIMVLISGCISAKEYHTKIVSYSVMVAPEYSDQAWSRAHAYLARSSGPLLKYAINPYIIQNNEFMVTREIMKNGTVIRINCIMEFTYLGSAEEATYFYRANDEWKKASARRDFMRDFLNYLQNGVSPIMVDKDIPPYPQRNKKNK